MCTSKGVKLWPSTYTCCCCWREESMSPIVISHVTPATKGQAKSSWLVWLFAGVYGRCSIIWIMKVSDVSLCTHTHTFVPRPEASLSIPSVALHVQSVSQPTTHTHTHTPHMINYQAQGCRGFSECWTLYAGDHQNNASSHSSMCTDLILLSTQQPI